ncbi:MAG: molybdopterin-guanine dinucleotide biosynthesis protein B [Chloroflexota bacterium]|nr:molybdopterin-guanine dinucleotide biosynthesis protein B [Anaerolineales bacterium]MCA9978039.1 molybdopterin-guanine dinucleotide biosynthesis protein B [Anaerolineales bacterium]MCB8965909.1 molybdopterin-guanine dinucleotide biosynthesis protein B [Ardenticatenaceae bacterium]
MSIPIISIIGKSGAGKTTLLEKVIAEIKRRGYRVATIKHHSHAGFDIDKPGKDSWRHAQAGSDHVIIAAPDKIASYRLLDRELTLDEIAAAVKDVDIIFTEGYRRAGKPTLEIIRAANSTEILSDQAERFALAADFPLDLGVPQFGLDDVQGIVDLIESRFLKQL